MHFDLTRKKKNKSMTAFRLPMKSSFYLFAVFFFLKTLNWSYALICTHLMYIFHLFFFLNSQMAKWRKIDLCPFHCLWVLIVLCMENDKYLPLPYLITPDHKDLYQFFFLCFLLVICCKCEKNNKKNKIQNIVSTNEPFWLKYWIDFAHRIAYVTIFDWSFRRNTKLLAIVLVA